MPFSKEVDARGFRIHESSGSEVSLQEQDLIIRPLIEHLVRAGVLLVSAAATYTAIAMGGNAAILGISRGLPIDRWWSEMYTPITSVNSDVSFLMMLYSVASFMPGMFGGFSIGDKVNSLLFRR